jgi:hypothetical protein
MRPYIGPPATLGATLAASLELEGPAPTMCADAVIQTGGKRFCNVADTRVRSARAKFHLAILVPTLRTATREFREFMHEW